MALNRTLQRLGLLGLLVACAVGCSSMQPGSNSSSGTASSASAPESSAAIDPATEYACQQFFGDPDYTDPQAYQVLAMGASALQIGGTNDVLFQNVADDVAKTFDQSEENVKQAAGEVQNWFTTEPSKGSDADTEALHTALTNLASACAPMSVAATWESGAGEPGTKPAKLVCAEIATKPQLFTEYRNGNVFTSNSFDAVGFRGKRISKSRMRYVESLNSILVAEIEAVDNDDVKAALIEIQKPFTDAIAGDRDSHGTREALEGLGSACEQAGYQGAVDVPENWDGEENGEGGIAGE